MKTVLKKVYTYDAAKKLVGDKIKAVVCATTGAKYWLDELTGKLLYAGKTIDFDSYIEKCTGSQLVLA